VNQPFSTSTPQKEIVCKIVRKQIRKTAEERIAPKELILKIGFPYGK